MASRVLSQIVEAKRFSGTVSHSDAHHTNQSFLCGSVRLYQAGAVENQDQAQPLCLEIQALSQRFTLGLHDSAAIEPVLDRRVR